MHAFSHDQHLLDVKLQLNDKNNKYVYINSVGYWSRQSIYSWEKITSLFLSQDNLIIIYILIVINDDFGT